MYPHNKGLLSLSLWGKECEFCSISHILCQSVVSGISEN